MAEAGDSKRKGFIRRYIFSTDHKVVGIQYVLGASFFSVFGFSLILLMRWQLAYPEKAVPILKNYLGEENVFMPGGVIQPDFYNSMGAMHGTIMVFLAVVPFLLGGFGNYMVPLQIGAKEMAFPRLNMMSFWVYVLGGMVMLYTFVLPDGPPNSGWTSYPPLSIFAADGQTLCLSAWCSLLCRPCWETSITLLRFFSFVQRA